MIMMEPRNLEEVLYPLPYPGRGILIGNSKDGKRAVIVYFIMGRSENSRNRIFAKTADGIRTKAHDPSKLTDPSLIIYHPVRVIDGRTIVTNGDQTDTVRDYLADGKDFRTALLTREFEPDAPNYTPRISGLVEQDGSYTLSILKSANGNPDACHRYFYEYSTPIPGTGHFISTYMGYDTYGDEPLLSFASEPYSVKVSLSNGLTDFALSIWYALNKDNRVSLYARELDIASGDLLSDIIINERANIPAHKQAALTPMEDK